MKRKLDPNGHNYKGVIYFVDVIILVSVFSIFVNYLVEVMGWRNYDGDSRFYWNRYGHVFVFLLSYIFSVMIIKIKNKDLDSMMETAIRAIAQMALMYLFFTFIVVLLFHTFPGHLLLWTCIINTTLVTISHCIITKYVLRCRKRPENTVNILMIGDDENNRLLSSQIGQGVSTIGYNQLGYFDIEQAEEQISMGNVDEVYCSLNPVENKVALARITKLCEDGFVSFYYVPNMDGYPHRRMQFTKYGDVTLLSLHNEPLADAYNRIEKRLFDLIFSGIFLISVFPFIWLFVAIGTKISSPGPIFFRQQRTGYNGKSFTMLKFRSMRVNSDADKLQATEDDPRKTRFGNLLRRTSIDELPQLINVFRGEMSVIGPRPHMEYHTDIYSKLIDEYLVRHLSKPGITGWAQVNGCRGETKTVEEMAERVKLDIWYIENWSLLLDLRILVKTVLNIFRGDRQAY